MYAARRDKRHVDARRGHPHKVLLSPMPGAMLPAAGERFFAILQKGLAAAQARPLPTYMIAAWHEDDDDIIDIEDIPILDDWQLSLNLPEVPAADEQPPRSHA